MTEIWLKTDFSSETMEARKQQAGIFKVLKKSVTRNTISYRLIFQKEGKIKQRLKEFIASRPILQEILKEVLLTEIKWNQRIMQIYVKEKKTKI